ncbi:MAG: chromosome segregation protein SMC, partial [Duodenibacillus sp.]|nr:chromosome segregation protein SMC [Duodenibacillus sp.]
DAQAAARLCCKQLQEAAGDPKATKLSVGELQQDIEQAGRKIEELIDSRAKLDKELEEDGVKAGKREDIQREINALRPDCEAWQTLKRLIGSHDGKLYQRFAQGITFEELVRLANRSLAKLCPRYRLKRDLDKPLSLNVVDREQAGAERTCKNLSGGESFLVSLALALGLASLASKNVKIDTLFLDEGFGTLDQETLDQALRTLAQLASEGDKLVGVISHVEKVKEAIPAAITVEVLAGGASRVTGPGVSRAEG